MTEENIYSIIHISEYSLTIKYLQIVNSVIKSIEEGRIKEDYLLPSINDVGYELEISRDTAVRAYRDLKKMGIVQSVSEGY